MKPDAPRLTGDLCRCGACGESFGRTSTFDRHRAGPYTDRRCQPTGWMLERGWFKDDRGFWRTARRMLATLPAGREGT